MFLPCISHASIYLWGILEMGWSSCRWLLLKLLISHHSLGVVVIVSKFYGSKICGGQSCCAVPVYWGVVAISIMWRSNPYHCSNAFLVDFGAVLQFGRWGSCMVGAWFFWVGWFSHLIFFVSILLPLAGMPPFLAGEGFISEGLAEMSQQGQSCQFL